MTRGVFSSDRPAAREFDQQEIPATKIDSSLVLLRNSVAYGFLTLILLPGGFRAFMHYGQGWEAWSFSHLFIVTVIVAHLLFCWVPLAVKYFRRGACRDVPAFAIATMTLYVQLFIGYALFQNYAHWQGVVS